MASFHHGICLADQSHAIDVSQYWHAYIYIYIHLPTCLPTDLPTHLPTCLPTSDLPPFLPTCLPTYQPTSTHLPPAYLPPAYLPTYLPTCLPTYLPLHSYVSIYLPSFTQKSVQKMPERRSPKHLHLRAMEPNRWGKVVDPLCTEAPMSVELSRID